MAGFLPASVGCVGKKFIDSVIAADFEIALQWLGLESVLVVALVAMQRWRVVVQSLLRAQLGHRVNVMILDKALTLSVSQFEDADFFHKLTRARRRLHQGHFHPFTSMGQDGAYTLNPFTPGECKLITTWTD